MKRPPNDRAMAPQWQYGRKLEKHLLWRLTLAERVKIILGMNVIINMTAYTQHSPGEVALGIFPHPTSATDPNDPQLAFFLRAQSEKAALTRVDNLPDSQKPKPDIWPKNKSKK